MKILAGKNAVPCKVVMTVYMERPYYSAAMLIPVQDIFKQISTDPVTTHEN